MPEAETDDAFDVTVRPEPSKHRLFGSVCLCGEWVAGCGHDVPEQWRQHANGAEPRTPPGSPSAGQSRQPGPDATRPSVELCPEIMVGAHPGQPDELWTCGQRAGHPGPHNRLAPSDGCTAWADHCGGCAEHDCICAPTTTEAS